MEKIKTLIDLRASLTDDGIFKATAAFRREINEWGYTTNTLLEMTTPIPSMAGMGCLEKEPTAAHVGCRLAAIYDYTHSFMTMLVRQRSDIVTSVGSVVAVKDFALDNINNCMSELDYGELRVMGCAVAKRAVDIAAAKGGEVPPGLIVGDFVKGEKTYRLVCECVDQEPGIVDIQKGLDKEVNAAGDL